MFFRLDWTFSCYFSSNLLSVLPKMVIFTPGCSSGRITYLLNVLYLGYKSLASFSGAYIPPDDLIKQIIPQMGLVDLEGAMVLLAASFHAEMQPCSQCSLSACLPACLPVCLSVCLSACLPACLSVCLSAQRWLTAAAAQRTEENLVCLYTCPLTHHHCRRTL